MCGMLVLMQKDVVFDTYHIIMYNAVTIDVERENSWGFRCMVMGFSLYDSGVSMV